MLRNGRISSMRAVEVASSRLLFVSPASQANASGTMPAASVEVSIGSLLISIIKNNFKKKKFFVWVRPDNIAALDPYMFKYLLS